VTLPIFSYSNWCSRRSLWSSRGVGIKRETSLTITKCTFSFLENDYTNPCLIIALEFTFITLFRGVGTDRRTPGA